MALTLRQVEAFHAVMSAGGVTRAADLLGVSQPAISRMIAEFEAAVGFPLFLRASRTLVPTPRARALHAEVERSFLGLGHIAAIAAGLRERGEGQLRLVVVPSLLPMACEGPVAEFARRFPAAGVSIEVAAALNAIDWAAARHADLGITTEDIVNPSVIAEPIGRIEAVCVMPAAHRLAAIRRPIRPRDLADALFVSFRPDSAFRAEIDRVFDAAAVARDLRIEARTTAAVCELVAALGGVAVVPVGGPHLAADTRLAVRPFAPRLISPVALIRPTGAPLSPLASEFAAIVRRMAAAGGGRAKTG
jgi:DNA-binding transcriptional LysR family regulator